MKKIVFGEMVCRWSQMSAAALLLTFMAANIYRMVTDSVGRAWGSGRIIQQR